MNFVSERQKPLVAFQENIVLKRPCFQFLAHWAGDCALPSHCQLWLSRQQARENERGWPQAQNATAPVLHPQLRQDGQRSGATPWPGINIFLTSGQNVHQSTHTLEVLDLKQFCLVVLPFQGPTISGVPAWLALVILSPPSLDRHFQGNARD